MTTWNKPGCLSTSNLCRKWSFSGNPSGVPLKEQICCFLKPIFYTSLLQFAPVTVIGYWTKMPVQYKAWTPPVLTQMDHRSVCCCSANMLLALGPSVWTSCKGKGVYVCSEKPKLWVGWRIKKGSLREESLFSSVCTAGHWPGVVNCRGNFDVRKV